MDRLEFKKILLEYLTKIDIVLDEKSIESFYKYMNILLEWNEKINLTAIIEPKEIILKHFVDSISINKYINNANTIFDIGTGAGFPGIPLKIINSYKEFILVDSLNKRINFLEEVKKSLELDNINLIHSRVEDLANNKVYRETGDAVVSRAVANLRVLVEYMLPFIKVGGECICMKGPNIEEELKEAQNAIDILGGKIERIDNIILPEDIERNIILIRKVKPTPGKYPRKAGTPVKKPL